MNNNRHRRDPGNKQRVVVGPADHAVKSQPVSLARCREGRHHRRIALRGRVGIYKFSAHGDPAAGPDLRTCSSEFVENRVASRLVNVPNIDLNPAPCLECC